MPLENFEVSRFNLRMPNAEVWKQLTKVRAKCSNILNECSGKSCKFHSRSLLGLKLFKRRFRDGGGGPWRSSRFELKCPGSTRDAAQSVGCEEGSKNVCFRFKSKRIRGKGNTRYIFSRGLLSLALPLSPDRPKPTYSVVGLELSR